MSPVPAADPPARASRRVARVAVGVALSALLIGLLLSQIDPARAIALVLGADPVLLSVGAALYGSLVVLRSLRYRVIAPDVPMRTLLTVHAVHALLLRLMPLKTGELGFAWLMARSNAGGFSRNLLGLVMLRVLDLTTVLSLFTLGLVLFGSASFARGQLSLAPLIAAAVVAALAPLYLRGLLRAAARLLDLVLALTRLERVEPVARAQRSVRESIAWSDALPRRALVVATGLTTVQWLVNYVLFFVLLEAMAVDVTVAQAVLGGSGSVLGSLLPVAGVGTFGPLEAGWAVGFVATGMDAETAIASGFGFSVISLGYSAIAGLIGGVFLRR